MPQRILTVHLSIRDSLPKSYAPLLRRAAVATVQAVPQSVWRRCVFSGDTAQVSITSVGPGKMRSLNRNYRKKDRPTDVLSFPAPAMPGSDALGDLVLSWKVAQSQLEAFGTTGRQEVQRLVVHGMLHLLRYDHETSPADARRMFRLQEKILKQLPN